MTTTDVLTRLRRLQGKRSLRQFARDSGISAPYLSDIYLGKRTPGPKVLALLGLQARRRFVVEYHKERHATRATTRNR